MKRKFAVLGLGSFGSALATTLSKNGADVIAMDLDMDRVEALADEVALAVQGDFTKLEVMEEAGVADCDVAIVATGARLEVTILAIMNLEKLGVGRIIAKTTSLDYSQVLQRVGADRVIIPEIEMGVHFANELSSTSFHKILHLEENLDLMEFRPHKKWLGQTIDEVDFRRRFGVNIVAMRDDQDEFTSTIDPQHVIHEDDLFIGLTDNEEFKQFFS